MSQWGCGVIPGQAPIAHRGPIGGEPVSAVGGNHGVHPVLPQLSTSVGKEEQVVSLMDLTSLSRSKSAVVAFSSST